MQDINKAIQIEQNYLIARAEGRDYSLPDALKEVGFNTLNNYFEAKKLYQIKHCDAKIIRASVEESLNVIRNQCTNKTPTLLLVTGDKPYIWHGTEPYDADYCKAHDIAVYEIGHKGGTIVGSPQDLAVGLFLPCYIDVDYNWVLNQYADMFRRIGCEVTVDHNDLMYKGRKVMGCTNMQAEGLYVNVCNISFGDSTNLIKHICMVKDVKQAGTLPVSRDAFEAEVIRWVSR